MTHIARCSLCIVIFAGFVTPGFAQSKSGVSKSVPKVTVLDSPTGCQPVVARVDANEAVEYKNWVMACGVAVAEATKEGGFLGFRKKLVTDDERDAMAQIAQALGATMPQLP